MYQLVTSNTGLDQEKQELSWPKVLASMLCLLTLLGSLTEWRVLNVEPLSLDWKCHSSTKEANYQSATSSKCFCALKSISHMTVEGTGALSLLWPSAHVSADSHQGSHRGIFPQIPCICASLVHSSFCSFCAL